MVPPPGADLQGTLYTLHWRQEWVHVFDASPGAII